MLCITGTLAINAVDYNVAQNTQVLRHVVLLDLNDQATDSVITMMSQHLKELHENLTPIQQLEFGTNIQVEVDYNHCMILTFESAQHLKEYEEHPMHLKFVSTYGKYVNKKTEVDYRH